MSEINNCCGTTCDKAKIRLDLNAKSDRIIKLEELVKERLFRDKINVNSGIRQLAHKQGFDPDPILDFLADHFNDEPDDTLSHGDYEADDE